MERILYDILAELELQSSRLGLSYVDEDFGQLEALDNEEDTYPLTFPAVLAEVQGVSWNHTDRLQQEGTATVVVRLLIDCYDDTHANSTQMHKILEREELNSEIVKLIHGLRILDNTSMLTRISSNTYNGPHLIKVYETTYTAKVWEKFDTEKTTVIQSVKISKGLI